MTEQYTLHLSNQSALSGNALLFLKAPQPNEYPELVSVVWMAQGLCPGAQAEFVWADRLCFVWQEKRQPSPLASVTAYQTLEANLSEPDLRAVELRWERFFQLAPLKDCPDTGGLTIQVDRKVPDGAVWAGLGMASLPALLQPCHPSIPIRLPTAPEIWLCFDTTFSLTPGTALPLNIAGNGPQTTAPVKLDFPLNTTHLSATLGGDNLWSLSPQ